MSSTAGIVVPPEISAAFCQATEQPESCEHIDDMRQGGAWESIWNYNHDNTSH